LVTGKTKLTGFLHPEEVQSVVSEGLAALDLAGRNVLVLIPDGTRTMPMPLLFRILENELGGRVQTLDYLVAAGTHLPMNDIQLSKHLGCAVRNGAVGRRRIFNHQWDDPATFAHLGSIPASEISQLTDGLASEDVSVTLNRLILDYDHILICGPVFPHEVAGFSGGGKYFFPGIAGPDIIHFTHWLGALVTSYAIIGVAETPVRSVIDRAVRMIPRPHSLISLVTMHEGVAGVWCGDTREAWSAAASLSAQRHIVWTEKPYRRVLAIMPEMYDDLWTGAKGAYKMEPAVADGGEVVIYAPHIREISKVHGRLIEQIGYHCRDYFLAQWERFRSYPGGILAHSTHVKGQGTYDPATGAETPRIQVTLATSIPESVCRAVNLGYLDPAAVEPSEWLDRAEEGWLVVLRAGEMLYKVVR
jgi:nickel-dependent lactate racemase